MFDCNCSSPQYKLLASLSVKQHQVHLNKIVSQRTETSTAVLTIMMTKLRAGVFAVPISVALILAPLIAAAPLNATDLDSTKANSCVWEFSPTICGEGISYEELVYPQTTVCIPLAIPMKNVWTNECSSWFGES